MGLLYLHHVRARSAHGTRERKERRIQSAFQVQIIQVKEKKVFCLSLTLIHDQISIGKLNQLTQMAY